jgi:hypothetical protein
MNQRHTSSCFIAWLKIVRLAVLILSAHSSGLISLHSEPVKLTPADSPVDNPLKGLVPYAGRDGFPHSLEFQYLPLSELMTGPETFDWRPLDRLLDEVARRGNQTIFRVWLEFPDRPSGVPKFLLDAGVKLTQWNNGKDQLPRTNLTPDYENERLVAALERFIAALGQRYDGDPRIGFITAGLLGSWGEWHTFPRKDLFASQNIQRRVLDAYQKAFVKTRILVRYPTADNASWPVGYHDDSFAWHTLDTEEGSFMSKMKAAGKAAMNKWRTQPIGGEIRPEIWGQVFDHTPQDFRCEDFGACVRQTHVTWLMDSGMFQGENKSARIHRALEQVRTMGYDFFVQTADIRRKDSIISVQLCVTNQGVAPFYYDWKLELAAVSPKGTIVRRWPVNWKLTGLLPGEPPRIWRAEVDVSDLKDEQLVLAVRVVNPLPGGKPLRFANAEQDRDAQGWLSLGRLKVKNGQNTSTDLQTRN